MLQSEAFNYSIKIKSSYPLPTNQHSKWLALNADQPGTAHAQPGTPLAAALTAYAANGAATGIATPHASIKVTSAATAANTAVVDTALATTRQ